MTYNDTIECVESALKLSYDNYTIIIVDNGSNNDSFKILTKKFANINKIKIIKNEKNLGFAKGNNIGIEYARKQENCDFVFSINNDTVFNDKSILSKMTEKYSPQIGVLGPKIIGIDNRNQNPLCKKVTFKKIIKDILESFFYMIIDINTFHNSIFYKKFVKPLVMKRRKNRIFYQHNNPVLQGAAIMFTPSYFKHYQGFYPGTFLFYEEYILSILLKKKGLISFYVDNAEILHKESMSSKESFNNKSKIKSKYRLNSIMHCIKVMFFDSSKH